MILKKSNLYSYQKKAVNYILKMKRCGLALDMGLGKTISSLTAFSEIHNVRVKKLLIIAPLNVAQNVWHNELKKWEHTRHLKYSICVGAERKRLESLNAAADIYIINQENIKWLYEKGYNKFGMIIVDESHGFKNFASARFKYLRKITCKYIVLLTGTPTPNGYMDIWSQQYLIDKGELLGKTITKYRDKYFIYKSRTYEYICRNPKEISQLLKNNWLSMSSEDYLELPDKILKINAVAIDGYKEYKKFEKNYLIAINDEKIKAPSAGVLSNKLLQYCNGALYNEDGDYIELHHNKLDVLEEIINDHADENVLIAFNFKCDQERIKKRFKQAVTLTSENINEIEGKWNNKEISLLLCQASSAKGLNLQQGGRIIVWFGLTWSMESYKQFNARLHRQGQKRPVIIYHIVASKCKDEDVMKALEYKDLTQEELLNILKHRG